MVLMLYLKFGDQNIQAMPLLFDLYRITGIFLVINEKKRVINIGFSLNFDHNFYVYN